MSNVTNDLLLETLKSIQGRLSNIETDVADVKADMRSLKSHMAGFLQGEVAQDGRLASLETRVGRIETRLDLVD